MSVRFYMDADLLAEATQRQRAGRSFAGLAYAHQLQVTIGQCVHDLELIAGVGTSPTLLAGSSTFPCADGMKLMAMVALDVDRATAEA